MALSAWVGGAILFVINGIRLVTSPAFNDVQRDHMALIRFPPYYLMGFLLVGMAFLSLSLARRFHGKWVALTLVAVAFVLMIVDFTFIYLPLSELISPPGQPRTERFDTLHRLSEGINSLHVGLCFLAAVIVSRPVPLERDR